MDPRDTTDPAVADVTARAREEKAAHTSTSAETAAPGSVDPAVHDVVADAQHQAEERQRTDAGAPLADLIAARLQVRGQYDAVRNLPQYVKEEAAYKTRLDELDAQIAGRA
jgi:hypothetical protein